MKDKPDMVSGSPLAVSFSLSRFILPTIYPSKGKFSPVAPTVRLIWVMLCIPPPPSSPGVEHVAGLSTTCPLRLFVVLPMLRSPHLCLLELTGVPFLDDAVIFIMAPVTLLHCPLVSQNSLPTPGPAKSLRQRC